MFFAGVKVWTVGAGPEGQKISGELKTVAFSSAFSIAGGMTALVQKDIFATMTSAIMKGNYMRMCLTV